jgi:hypothetical protein
LVAAVTKAPLALSRRVGFNIGAGEGGEVPLETDID